VNEHDANEGLEDGLTPRCGYCGSPMIGQRADSQYCTRTCKQKARAKRRRRDARVDRYRTAYPDAADTWDGPGHDYAQGDNAGLPDDNEADNEPDTFSHLLRLHEAEQDIRARYERLMKPYLAQQRRNPGVRLPEIVALERERDRELAGLANTGDELDQASRREPQRINETRERQKNRAALQALGNDRYGSRPGRLRQPEFHGRSTTEIWRW
jgi:hypothetical protein